MAIGDADKEIRCPRCKYLFALCYHDRLEIQRKGMQVRCYGTRTLTAKCPVCGERIERELICEKDRKPSQT